MTSAKLELLAEADRSKQRYLDLVETHAQLSLETTNRKALETELFNARKLEAVGRLTGRFAHEFNNLLTAISGNLEFLEEAMTDQLSVDTLNSAQTAAQRGEKLIQAMLAFSQRSRLSPQIADLNTLVALACEQSNGRQNDAVQLNLAENPNLISVDPKFLDAVLLNLIRNARDAMPDGGEIQITTENIIHNFSNQQGLATALLPGHYVRLSINDSGVGIPLEGLQQIFDPFYTTKPVGAGIGLGLSMTLGFMQQSGGTVAVQSQVGQGSTFQLYFPTVSQGANDLLTINR